MKMELEIDLSELEAFMKDVEGLPAFTSAEIERAMVNSLGVLSSAITVRTPVNQGHLRGSTTKQRFGNPLGMYTGEIFTPLPYGLPVETGRAPGKMPPVSAIQLWVTRKLGLRGSEAKSAAFLIARAIGRRGTKGAFMFQKGLDASTPYIESLFEAIPGKIIARLSV